MFFGLVAIEDHPCCEMQQVVEEFFLNSISATSFSVDLFPERVRSLLQSELSPLRTKFSNVHTLLHARGMKRPGRLAIHQQIQLTNRVEDLCNGSAQLDISVIDWKSALGVAIGDLMLSLYETLDRAVFRREGTLGRPTHQVYDEFIKKNKYVCPFCSLGKLRNRKGLRREDFDHYLNKSYYCLAAANMRNLVPTCSVCNQDYKKAKDILADGPAFYPYGVIPKVEVEVDCQTYPAIDNFGDSGEWSVKLKLVQPDQDAESKMKAWDRVYCVKKRLEDEIQEFSENWMAELSDEHSHPLSELEFLELLATGKKKAIQNSERRMEPGQIIRAAFFDFMLSRAEKRFVESFRRLQNKRCLAA